VVNGLRDVRGLALGGSHSCALLDGSVQCWGDNSFGQLGDGTTVDRATPVLVHDLANPLQIGLGALYSCALVGTGVGSSNGVRCWGQNNFATLGDGTQESRSTPTLSVLSGAAKIAVVDQTNYAIMGDGTIQCWGICSGELTFRPTIVPMLTNVEDLVGGGFGWICIRTMSDLVSCGSVDMLSAISGLSSTSQLAVGEHYACALTMDHSVRCWGSNARGQLGDGTMFDRTAPVVVAW
jgi:alpha-tubulin suppressor-like RCC1 family protein